MDENQFKILKRFQTSLTGFNVKDKAFLCIQVLMSVKVNLTPKVICKTILLEQAEQYY